MRGGGGLCCSARLCQFFLSGTPEAKAEKKRRGFSMETRFPLIDEDVIFTIQGEFFPPDPLEKRQRKLVSWMTLVLLRNTFFRGLKGQNPL